MLRLSFESGLQLNSSLLLPVVKSHCGEKCIQVETVLRIISLSFFCLALLKLFFFDIANVSEGGKIAAFILLGVLLLTISFSYQKLKKMIIDEESR